ncbi:MAG: baseplate J/gp47 family protein [Lachnospiraceae bacterium]|nr:baseplate J/gp47 family protein [Lachnospiraceae bacterium]
MLSELNLDNEEYEDILEEARNIVIGMYPEWTDYNYHDPGITLLELFALMKESQQYFLNQIGEENRNQYLKLLGMQRKTKKAAKSLVRLEAEEDMVLLRNNKLGAGSLCFEVQGRKQLVGGDIRSCLAISGGKPVDYLERSQLEFGKELGFRPFGTQPQPGDACYICFERPLPTGVPLNLYLEVFQDYPVRRNPPGEKGFIPLVQVGMQYYDGEVWQEPEEFRDTTWGILFDGFVEFVLTREMKPVQIQGEEGCFLRLVLKEGAYDVAPIVTRLSMNICQVRQRDTLAEEQRFAPAEVLEMDTELAVTGRTEVWLFIEGIYYPVQGFEKEILEETATVQLWLADDRLEQAQEILVVNTSWEMIRLQTGLEGNGFSSQCMNLEDLQVEYASLQLLIQEPGHEGGYRRWQKVTDFGKSSPEDYHYIFDSRRGEILFGDCIHGRAPEGEVILTGYVRTMGSDGNVRRGTIDRFMLPEAEQLPVYNICRGTGGQEEETLEECFLRAKNRLQKPHCAVTERDYEEYAKKTPGLMIESCHLLHAGDIRQFAKKVDEAAVYLVIKPFGGEQDDRISRIYYRNIRNYLERYRLIGSRIFIYLPEYVYVEVYVDVVVKPQYQRSKELLQQTVEEFFREREKQFGGRVSYRELYGCIDRQKLVSRIRSLSMDTRGNGVRQNREGDILLSPNAVVVLKEVRCSLVIKE